MPLSASNPAFVVYALTVAANVLLLSSLWLYSGIVRAGTQTVANPEDGRKPVAIDPPPVARVLRAHANAQATVVPFLLLGLVFVALGGGGSIGLVLFAGFTAARVLHAVAYLAGKQPWRSIFYSLGMVATLVLLAEVVYRVWTR